MVFNAYVAMDITSSDVRVILVSGNRITKWGSAPLPEGLVKDGIIQDPEAASIIIDTLFKSLGLGRGRVLCTITGLPFIYRYIYMPGTEMDVDAEAIDRAARKEMSLTGEDMYLLWQATGKQPESDETEYFVLGVPRISFQPLLETLKHAKIKQYIVGIKPLALARTAALKNVCLASLERDYFDIVLVANGQVRVIHSINPSGGPEDKLGIINEFLDEFDKAVKSFNRDFPQHTLTPETPVLLAGELASNEEFAGMVQEATGYPSGILQPSTESLPEIPEEMPPGLYAAPIGLILGKIRKKSEQVEYHDIKINLLNGLRKPASKRKFSIAYAGAGVVILILAVLAYQVHGLKTSAEADVASLQQQSVQAAQQLVSLKKENKDLQTTRQSKNTDLQNLQAELTTLKSDNSQVEAGKMDYSVRMAAVIQALPEGATYLSIHINPSAMNISGTAMDPLDVITYARNLEKQQQYFPAVRVTQIAPGKDAGEVSFGVTAPN